MNALPRALFHGLFLAAALLGVVEAVHLLSIGALDEGDRVVAAVYVTAPYVLFGLIVATTTAALAGLWARARRLTSRSASDGAPGRSADAGAGLLAVVFFTGIVYVAARLILAYTHNRVIGAAVLALVVPLATASALYFWAIARDQLARLDARLGPVASRGLTGLLALGGVTLIALTIARNEALRERLGGWTVAFTIAYPLVTAALTLLLRRVSAARLAGPAVRRGVMAVGLVSALGAVDLVVHLDARAPVKQALLHETLVFEPLVLIAQPLFDADGDGYAGLLGGGDCDDDDPNVNPGAREIPRNALDDDCFGGDSPGTPGDLPAPAAPAAAPDPVEAGLELAPQPNMVLITIDTLRADRLGFAGHARTDISPALDRLARRGLRFTWAFSQGPQTKASMPSMFIGKYYSEVDRSPDLWATVHPENVTIAERLKDVGYHTAGIPSHRFFLPGYGLDQGFAEWDLRIVEKYGKRMPSVITGAEVTDAALEWLRARPVDGQPFLLWLHYFDPHHYYQDHPQYDFGTDAEALYDEEIRYTDDQLGRLLDWIDTSPLMERTYVIVHSDHGEGFYEHGYRYHGQHLFNDQVRVPLIIAGPGLPSRQIDTPVALIDVAPTMLDLAGQPTPSGMHGRSLLAWASGPRPTHRPVFVEMVKDATHSDRRAIIDWPWKLHYGITFNQYRLYDLSVDPNEQNEIKSEHPDEFERLRNRLRQWMSEEVEPSTPRRRRR